MAAKIRQIQKDEVNIDLAETDQSTSYIFSYSGGTFANRIAGPLTDYLVNSSKFKLNDEESDLTKAVFENDLVRVFINGRADTWAIHCKGKLNMVSALEAVFGRNKANYTTLLSKLGLDEKDLVSQTGTYLDIVASPGMTLEPLTKPLPLRDYDPSIEPSRS